jgi:hypothetical protein
MFIPTWLIWAIGIIAVLIVANVVGKSRGDYDFVSPLLGLGVILVAIAFGVGYLIGT